MSEQALSAPHVAVGSRAAGVALLGGLLAGLPAADRGGYLPGTWSWLVLATFFLATLVLLVGPSPVPARLDVALLGALVAFTAWIGLSALWAPAFTPVAAELTRALAYVGAVGLVLLVVRRATVEPLLWGALVGVTLTAGYALATRLLPDRLGSWDPESGYRLADPIGYWNGLGVYAAAGALLALGLAVRSRSRFVRASAGLAPPILVATVLFTFSRGAWVALAVGLLAAFALDPRRLQLAAGTLVLGVWPAAVVLAAARADELTDQSAPLARLAAAGEDHARVVVVAALACGLCALAFGELCDRVTPPRALRVAFAALLAGLAVAGLAAFWSWQGAPWEAADRAWSRFTAPPKASGSDATDRLFDLSANGRIELWRVSRTGFEQSPLHGTGAGSFASEWFRERDSDLYSREGHSLYAETLGELGLVGLALLVVALLVPLVAAVRARREPLVAAALAAYVATIVHAGVDWDWELAGVTLPALVAAAALVVLARPRGQAAGLPAPVRTALPVVTGVVALVGVALVLANVSADRSRIAAQEGRWAQALEDADRAVRWAPWSSTARQERARALLGLGRVREARVAAREALDRTPNDHELWVDLAAASPPAAALTALERAVALNPRDASLRDLLAARRAAAAAGG